MRYIIIIFTMCYYIFIFSMCYVAKKSDEKAKELFNKMMGEKIMETKVIFRKFKDTKSIIAIFPDLGYPKHATKGNIMSYMYIGQHSECSYDIIMRMTNIATPKEHEFLHHILEDMGYTPIVTTKEDYEKSLTIV